MPQTTNYGFPLLADTPPEGMTGKDLRKMILGEGEESLAQMLDAALKALADAKEDASNKVVSGQSWMIDDGDRMYLSANRTRELIKASQSSVYTNLTKYTLEIGQYDVTQVIEWSGYDSETVLFGHHKAGEYVSFPDCCALVFSLFKGGYLVSVITEERIDTLKDEYGIVLYGSWSESQNPLEVASVIACDRSGTLPADVIRTISPDYTGEDVPYEAGVYLFKMQASDDTLYTPVAAGLNIPEAPPTKVSQLVNDSEYISKDEVARQIAAILPEFSAADNGKVLGIQNGKLAWVTVQTSGGVEASVDGTTLVLGDGATVDGNTLVLDGDASVDGSTLILGG